jgi:bifunctional DNA-binding transcriptional regulator/antitoxin component of YhaV-PrlF toxin-antitoxin module
MRFHTTILSAGKTAAGIVIPLEVVEALGSSRKPPVRVTIRDYTYRSTVATVDGRFMVGVSAENRAKAGVAGGDEVDVDIELDTEPRTVELPADFAAVLAREPKAEAFFETLSNSQKGWFVSGIEGAKTQETRQRRIAGALERLREGRGQR